MNYDVLQIPDPLLDLFEKDIKHYIQLALDKGPPKYTSDDIFRFIKAGAYQVFAVIDNSGKIKAVATTTVDKYSLAKVLTVLQLGSDIPFEELKPLFDRLQDWAISEGCDYAEIYGRRGWSKVLDFDVAGLHLTKNLK